MTPTTPTTSLTLTPDDVRLIHEHLSYDEARAAKATLAAVQEFIAAANKEVAAYRIAERLTPLGVRGLSLKSLYRKAQAATTSGWRGVIDGRTLRKLKRVGLAGCPEFVAHWHTLVCGNQRKTAPAWRALLDSIHHGHTIPGVGNWRDIWMAENPGQTPPSVCPYGTRAPHNQIPRQMSYSALRRIQPTAFGLRAARVGTMAASTDYLPEIRRTRAGLKRCQVIQIDDMWDNAKVMFGKNRYGERVVELSAVDVLTGRIICYLSKPIIRRADNTRETLRAEWVRYLIGHIVCNLGIPDSLLIMGEHGTATADADLQAALAEVSGGRVTFGAGGLLSQPIAKGLYDGRPKGNPKYKGLIESLHNLKQNEMASIKGQIGSRDSMGNEPESVYGMDKAQGALAAAVTALAASRPGIQERLSWPFIPWVDYSVLKAEYYNAINRRTWHNMEGWDECGFITGEWRPEVGQPWMPMSALEAMGPAAAAVRSVIDRSPPGQLFRTRRMSPEEAWHIRANEVTPLGDWAMPRILGPALARACTVGQNLTITFRDDTTMRQHTIYALINGSPLQRGQQYHIWVNPCDCTHAYVADLQHRYIGTAPIAQAAMHDDIPTITAALGVRQQALSAEIKTLRPIAAKRLREAAADAQRNTIEILGYDPVPGTITHHHLHAIMPDVTPDDIISKALPSEESMEPMVDLAEIL